ncbi:MAG: UDP-N-acetylmuramate dehydrogenase [Deltaproteobacteria bacterium]|nr:UDP-N-acetylmuramate dehydrogenase [Deltaproteobacteria bacterium]
MAKNGVSGPVKPDLAESRPTGRGIQSMGGMSEKAAAGATPPRTCAGKTGPRKPFFAILRIECMFSTRLKTDLKNLLGEAVVFDAPLAAQTSIRIGGPADGLFRPQDAEGLKKALGFAREKSIPVFVLGKGSNTLVRDGGFRGLVIHLGLLRRFEKTGDNGSGVWVTAQSGVPTPQLIRWAALEGLAGLECLAGVPGTVGGNVFMNAGTYLGEIGDKIQEVKILDNKGNERVLKREKLKFEYRTSNIPPSSIILEAVFLLQKGEKEKIEQKIREAFEKRGLAQPVEQPSLGSVFKNPGKKKAWELIEEAGLKGVRVEKARISEKHANFIVNEGGATAKDVEVLIRMVRDRVKQATGELLETEIKVVGEG